jgi:hypothetical protein
MLDLPDPSAKGARRIKDAIDVLEAQKLITVEDDPGKPPRLILMDETGSGEPYLPPFKRVDLDRYLQIPAEFWSSGWVVSLSGPAVCVLLIMLDQIAYENGKPSRKPFWLSPKMRHQLYPLSEDSWTKGCDELASHRLIRITRESIPAGAFGFMRSRNTFRVFPGRLSRQPKLPSGDAET